MFGIFMFIAAAAAFCLFFGVGQDGVGWVLWRLFLGLILYGILGDIIKAVGFIFS